MHILMYKAKTCDKCTGGASCLWVIDENDLGAVVVLWFVCVDTNIH